MSKVTFIEKDDIKYYFNDIKNIKPLSREEEAALYLRIKNGCEISKHKLIRCNLKFVVSVAKKYYLNDGFHQIEDLISVGNIGLVEAAKKFNYNSDIKFISFAVHYIRGHILDYLTETNYQIYLPKKRYFGIKKINEAKDNFYKKTGYYPSDEILSATFSKKDILSAKIAENATKINNLYDENISFEEELCQNHDNLIIINLILNKLKDLPKNIIIDYYGINTRELSLEELGKKYSMPSNNIESLIKINITRLKKLYARQ